MTIPLSSPWQTLLASPGPDGHVVQLYQDEGFFGEAVSHFAAQGVAQGDAVILVATQPHWDLLADCLADKGLALVKGLAKKVITEDQQSPSNYGDEDHYYVAVAE